MSLGFRRLEYDDLALLGGWLAQPHVEPWWREDPGPDAVRARYGPAIDGTDPTEVFIVEVEGEPVGMMQRYRLADNPAWRTSLAPTLPSGTATDTVACIDYLLGSTARIGQGIGPRMIEAFTGDLFARYPEVDTVAVAVNRDNRRSWRALEKAGYHRVYEGEIVSDDPADEGVHVVSVRRRGPPDPAGRGAGGPPGTP